eukprot:TRINITY_DN3887_c3_g1_i2.p1 TRINITY_DN3887_c3_g1~~TRINITY_DN3887_c3_g1_i2.p1  ORF type:complete len:751 (+),score=227.06 TRINITY_DN3887_c3_g1_i2:160-2412(+)
MSEENENPELALDGGITMHPAMLSYVKSTQLSAETRKCLAAMLKNATGVPALLWAGIVNKVGRRVISQKRLLVISAVAVHQYSTSLNRNINITEIEECLTYGTWLGIKCPTQYDVLFSFADEKECETVAGILKILAAFLNPKRELVVRALPPEEKIKSHLQLAKPIGWTEMRIMKIKIPTKMKVQSSHEAAERAKAEEMNAAEEQAVEEKTIEEPTPRSSQISAVTVKPPSGPSISAETESPVGFSRIRSTLQDDERRQMEEDVESLTMAASEWERKAGVLRVREAQLESQLKIMKTEADIMKRKIEDLTMRNDTLTRTCDQQSLEIEHFQKERRAACKELSIDPDGDVSLTEAARRIEARHDGLTDSNWELTKQIAILEKQLKAATSNPQAHLEADAEALQQLISIRSADLHTVDRQRSDARNIQTLTKQLHKTKQQHEETKLKLFEVEENYSSLENRFKEHSVTMKNNIKSLEKKLKEAQKLSPGVLQEEYTEKPRFSTSTPTPNSTTQHNSNTKQVSVGTHVNVNKNGALPVSGVARYIGKLKGVTGQWVGVELDEEDPAACDGTVNGVSYFKTTENRALFVRASAISTKPPPSVRARSKSPSMSPTMPPPPPSYGARETESYLELALSYKEELHNVQGKLRVAESQASVMPPPPTTPTPTKSRGRSASPSVAEPPAYPNKQWRERSRDRSRDRSPSPNVPMQPHELALREAVSSCVAQLGALPKPDPKPTNADLFWVNKKTMLGGL